MFAASNRMFKSAGINYKDQIIAVIYTLAFLGLMVYLLFNYVFSFNYELYLNQQYILVFWMPILALLLLWLFNYYGHNSYELRIGLLLIVFITSLLCFSSNYSFSNEYFFTISIIVLACYGLFLLNQVKVLEAVVLAFVILFLVQLYLGIQQRCSLGRSDGLLISGSLQNSGVYAYYLVFNLPFFYWFCFGFSKRYAKAFHLEGSDFAFKLLFVLVLVTVVYFIHFTQSRTAFICLGVMTGYFSCVSYKSEILTSLKLIPKRRLLLIGTLSVGGMLWLSIWLFNLKKMSAIGRMLSFDIAWQHVVDHFWLGTGLGRFTWYYPQWQAAYFNIEPNPKLTYFFSAAESYIIFNEYLQLFETIGLFGFLFCGYGFYRFFKLRSINNSDLLLASKCTVIAIMGSGFTSYPLHVNIILLLLGTSLAIGFTLTDRPMLKPAEKQGFYLNKVLIILCLFSVCITFYKGYTLYHNTTKWIALRNSGSAEILDDYKNIYPVMSRDGKFLTEYGMALLADSTQIFTAIKVLEKAKQYFITRKTIESLVIAYRSINNYNSAIQNQQFLVNYLPNKFSPRYDLLQLYVLQNDTLNIRKTGGKILQMPVKIPSFEVSRIKQNTHNILKKHL